MNLITFENIKSLSISPSECYKWVEETIHSKSSAILPPKISIKPSDGVFCNVMPGIIPYGTEKFSRGGGKGSNTLS